MTEPAIATVFIPPLTSSGSPVIDVRGLTKLSLRELDLRVDVGERVAIIGRTGEGKSVLLRCILGLLRVEGGSIQVLGSRVSSRAAGGTTGIGVAFQSPGLFDQWSVAENLRVASSEPLNSDEVARRLRSVGLENVDPESSVTQLSGGQQKRLRALVRGTSLVVLDEPAAGSAADAVKSPRKH